MLAFPRILIDLRGLGLGDITGIKPADGATFGMHGQHDPGCHLAIEVEEGLKYLDHEIHGGVVIIEQDHLIERRRLQCRLGLLDGQA